MKNRTIIYLNNKRIQKEERKLSLLNPKAFFDLMMVEWLSNKLGINIGIKIKNNGNTNRSTGV